MPVIERSEYLDRQVAFANSLARAGLPGAIVFSRGGSTLDRFADVFYLTGFYQSYGYLPETPGLFSGRAHAALIQSADGRSILCVAVPEFDAERVVAGDVRSSEQFAGTIV